MYIKVRKIDSKPDGNDLIIHLSKISLIQDIQKQIEEKWNIAPESQRLFYKGKQLSEQYRVLDYDIQLNDVIQLYNRPNVSDKSHTVDSDTDQEVEAKSSYYRVGDLVDIRDTCYSAWFEAVLLSIKKKKSSENHEQFFIFYVRLEREKDHDPLPVYFEDIRPRAWYTYKLTELSDGQTVMVNYNIENPDERGYWYDFCIGKVSKGSKRIVGTLQIGQNATPLKNCRIRFINEIMRIEKPSQVSKKQNVQEIPMRVSASKCQHCKDIPTKKCKECGCSVCGGKQNPGTILMCDECDAGFHISCLNPPLSKIPDVLEWYCPDCKNDDSEIVKAGDELKISKRKAQLRSFQKDCSRDWGRGMACVGRTKVCTIVSMNHYGPVPGIEVGTCWKFRLQVSEAGIHRPHVAGIHGRETDGAYSLILSGGYEDDVDNGEEFLYTGSGGRDLSGNKRSSEQSCDQVLTRMNKALALNCNAPFNAETGAEAKDWKNGKPVRVVRNYKLRKHSKYAPKEGNRYDGIYKVVKYYREKGKSGFYVWRYLLKRDDPTPAPWTRGGQELEMIYPDGYLEAQENNKNTANVKNKESKKRPLEDRAERENKRPRVKEFSLSSEVTKLIQADKLNKKLWKECSEYIAQGKQTYLRTLQEVFNCVCCQEVVYKPVTTECKHNICQECLRRSFDSEIYSCPYCRKELGQNYKMKINNNLSQVLCILLPGYELSR